MRIAFLTSCLESGKDGVGDYTQMLAEECTRQGHSCCLVALNDRFLISPYQQTEIEFQNSKIPSLRLAANKSWYSRIIQAKAFLETYQPEWISLQFVCYGFHDKGIVLGLGKYLQTLTKSRKVHMMFHELWIGEYINAGIKDRIIGQIQRFFILRLVKQLRPKVIHSTNRTYVEILKQNSIRADCLKLFGAIPIAEQNGDRWLFPLLQDRGIEITSENRHQFWQFGIFGTLHPTWPPEPLFTYLKQASALHGRKIVLISIGRIGKAQNLWENMIKIYRQEFIFLQLGERSPVEVSEFFNSIDFGIATSPYILVGKSATVAAMIEHGLPIIVNRDDIKFRVTVRSDREDNLIQKMDSSLVQNLDKINRSKPKQILTEIANNFVSSLI